jgi:hypothetical protein
MFVFVLLVFIPTCLGTLWFPPTIVRALMLSLHSMALSKDMDLPVCSKDASLLSIR